MHSSLLSQEVGKIILFFGTKNPPSSILETMGLDQLQMAPLVPDDSLLHSFTTQGKVFVMQQETFSIRDK